VGSRAGWLLAVRRTGGGCECVDSDLSHRVAGSVVGPGLQLQALRLTWAALFQRRFVREFDKVGLIGRLQCSFGGCRGLRPGRYVCARATITSRSILPQRRTIDTRIRRRGAEPARTSGPRSTAVSPTLAPVGERNGVEQFPPSMLASRGCELTPTLYAERGRGSTEGARRKAWIWGSVRGTYASPGPIVCAFFTVTVRRALARVPGKKALSVDHILGEREPRI